MDHMKSETLPAAKEPRTSGPVRIGVLGCGYWGPNLIRNFAKLRVCEILAVADVDPRRLEPVQWAYPKIKTLSSPEALLYEDAIEAVVIVTPVSTHYALAKTALENDKHVLLEKPLAASVKQAEELVQLAEERGKILMVDHTFVYTGAVRKIRQLIDTGEFGEIYYYDSVRVNLGLFQRESNVLWDLGPHDFSIMDYLIDEQPTGISAIGAKPVRRGDWAHESVVYVAIHFKSGLLAHFHLNWLSPVKVRRTLIGGSKKMIVYDHLDPDNQLKVFDKGVEVSLAEDLSKVLVQYRTGDMWAPKVDQTEALEIVCKHFIDCVQTGGKPITNGQVGLQIVRLLEAAQESMARHGEVIEL
jgi:predicted dehydrogenase